MSPKSFSCGIPCTYRLSSLAQTDQLRQAMKADNADWRGGMEDPETGRLRSVTGATAMNTTILIWSTLVILGLASGAVAAEPRLEPVQTDTPGNATVSGSAAYEYSTVSEASSQLSIPVQGPDGNALRLDFRPGNGWRFSDAQGDGATALKVGTGIPEALESDHASPAGHPLSVTVDGPTGFVYAWMHDSASWKFVGRVSDHR
jgi:hypothetical protein